MRKKKAFDCVEMKDRIQAELQKKMAAMTPEERLAYRERRNKELREEVEALQALRKAS